MSVELNRTIWLNRRTDVPSPAKVADTGWPHALVLDWPFHRGSRPEPTAFPALRRRH